MAKKRADPFGFTAAVGKEAKGYFAVVDMGAKGLKATPVYSKHILDMYLEDNRLTHKVVRIFPESDYKRITGMKP